MMQQDYDIISRPFIVGYIAWWMGMAWVFFVITVARREWIWTL